MQIGVNSGVNPDITFTHPASGTEAVLDLPSLSTDAYTGTLVYELGSVIRAPGMHAILDIFLKSLKTYLKNQ